MKEKLNNWQKINLIIIGLLFFVPLFLYCFNKELFSSNINTIATFFIGGLLTQLGAFLTNIYNYSIRKEDIEIQERHSKQEKEYLILQRINEERIRSYNELSEFARNLKMFLPPYPLFDNNVSFPVLFLDVENFIQWNASITQLLRNNYGWYSAKAINELLCLTAYSQKLQEILIINRYWVFPVVMQEIGNFLEGDINDFSEKLLLVCDDFFSKEIFTLTGQEIIKKGRYSKAGVQRRLKTTVLFSKEKELTLLAGTNAI